MTDPAVSDVDGGPHPRRFLVAAATVVAVLGAAGAGWWANDVVLDEHSPVAPERSGEAATAEVTQASVGSTMRLAVTVRQPVVVVAANHLSGVVTAAGGGDVDTGEVLYEVAGVPVVAVQADKPFYRALTPGTRGDDVLALQRTLAELGHFPLPPDGRYGQGTVVAVQAWQRSLGQPASGEVPLGHMVALRRLPGTVALDDQITPGAMLTGGEAAVRAASGVREFVLVVSEEQQSLIPAGTHVKITYEGHTWEGVVSSTSVDPESSRIEMALTAPDGGPVCADECDALPASEVTSILSEVITVPPASGPAVPTAAVRTQPDGSTFVLLADGEQRPVTVRGAGQGLVVLDGVEIGMHVVLGAQSPAGQG